MDSSEAVSPRSAPPAGDLFGHPRGLTVLATTEMWERFSFYGMQALLMLYMTKYLLLPAHAQNVLGLAAFRSGVETVTGKLTDLGFAAQTYGIYSALIYGTPLLGAWLGDRVLGKTRTITLGCLLMSAGHLTMAAEHLFLVALALIVTGAGGVIGNMAAQVGQLYEAGDHRRTRAFGIYLITLNIGALAAPLVIGTVGERVGWHYGFAVAGMGMLIGLATYLAGRRHLPKDRIATRAERAERASLTAAEWRRIGLILLLMVPYMLYTIAAQQPYAMMYIWADTAVDRSVLGWQVPVTWIGMADGVMTIFGVLVANRIWIAQQRRGREPGDLIKNAIGYLLIALAYVYIALVALLPTVPVLMWIAFYLILDLGFGWSESPMQALVSRDSPPRVAAMMMSALKASAMFSYLLLGWIGRFFETLGPSRFWLLHAGIAVLAAVPFLLGHKRVARQLAPVEARLDS